MQLTRKPRNLSAPARHNTVSLRRIYPRASFPLRVAARFKTTDDSEQQASALDAAPPTRAEFEAAFEKFQRVADKAEKEATSAKKQAASAKKQAASAKRQAASAKKEAASAKQLAHSAQQDVLYHDKLNVICVAGELVKAYIEREQRRSPKQRMTFVDHATATDLQFFAEVAPRFKATMRPSLRKLVRARNKIAHPDTEDAASGARGLCPALRAEGPQTEVLTLACDVVEKAAVIRVKL
ncbi:hypothetical protein HYH03_016977 [Edaphochlamys debaryana]|uniref:Uncharacterized protein n=1 Tax=Edaphochlamys debaryana TaxID=47281 RepID=A0A836BR37_9CHLO|nr:hypothetical protein HYH03_016977 [Edaphochlamys debaryana]|eukprot:KAG2484243.1 hypothetical protein HYH03_016977 [Edaphochlamys debaryana]